MKPIQSDTYSRVPPTVQTIGSRRPDVLSVDRRAAARGLGRVAQMVVVAILLFTTLAPLYWLVTLSLKQPVDAWRIPPQWIPTSLTLDNFAQVLVGNDFYRFFINGMVIATGSALCSVALGSSAAYGLSTRFRGSDAIALAILATQMIPPIVLAIPIFMIMRSYGMLDTYQGLGIVYVVFTLPFATWLMRGFYLDIPAELEDAARVDGCSRFGAFARVILPLVRPGLIATGIFCFLLAWNEFLFALILTRSAASQTMPIAAYSFMSNEAIAWGKMAATGMIAIIPVIILMTTVQKYLLQGLTFGAVKG